MLDGIQVGWMKDKLLQLATGTWPEFSRLRYVDYLVGT
jgi:hypothetical protein